jgi:uncharacterized membrane protein YedE/YeeE
MKSFPLILLALIQIGQAESRERPSHTWAFSVAFFAGSQVLDVASSRGQMEANPILGRGTFGGRQIAMKGLLGGGLLLGEWLYTRRHPESRKAFTWVNYAAGAATVGIGLSNLDKRSK